MPSLRHTAGFAVASTVALAACGRRPPPPAPPTPEVGYVVAQPQAVPLTTELPGRVTAYVTADVRPQVNGIIKARLFTEGDRRAGKGQVLYQIDPKPPTSAAYDQAKPPPSPTRKRTSSRPRACRRERYADLVKINAVSKQDNDNSPGHLQARPPPTCSSTRPRSRPRASTSATRASPRLRLGADRPLPRHHRRPGDLGTDHGPGDHPGARTPIFVDVSQSSDELLEVDEHAMAGGAVSARPGPSSARATLVLSDGSKYPQSRAQLKFSEAQVDTTTGSVTLARRVPEPQPRRSCPGMYVREDRSRQAVDQDGHPGPADRR